MRASGKILGRLLSGLALLAIALGVALTGWFDPNDYREELRQLARDKIGLELEIRGKIGWHLLPWPGLQLQDLRLASSRSPERPLGSLERLDLSIRLLPLLRQRLEMGAIRLDGLQLELQRDELGRRNWEGIGQPPASPEPAEQHLDTGAATAPPHSYPPLALAIGSLTLHNSRLVYNDVRQGRQFSAEHLNFRSGPTHEDQAIPLQLEALLRSTQPALQASTRLQGDLQRDPAGQHYRLDNVRLDSQITGGPLKAQTARLRAQGNLMADLATRNLQWQNLKLGLNQLQALGELQASHWPDQLAWSGQLSLAPFSLPAFLQGLGQPAPVLANPQALSRVGLVTRLAGTLDSLQLDDLQLQLDDTRLNGQLVLNRLDGHHLQLDLTGNRLDTDRYRRPQETRDRQTSAGRQQALLQAEARLAASDSAPLPEAPDQPLWSDQPLLPLKTLRQLDTRISLKLEQLTLNHLPLEAFSLEASGAGGQLQLEHLQAGLYGGQIAGTARLDARPDPLRLNTSIRISNLPAEELLNALEQPDLLRGRLELQADLDSQGNSLQAWIHHLDGTARFSLHHGLLPNTRLERQICRGIALLNQKQLRNGPGATDTPFQRLDGSLTIRQGLAHTQDLQLAIPGMVAHGQGDLDLPHLGMDYRLGIRVEGDRSAQPDPACQVKKRYAGTEIPIRCRGPLELGAQACRLDPDALQDQASRRLESTLKETIDRRLDTISPNLKEQLKGLFN